MGSPLRGKGAGLEEKDGQQGAAPAGRGLAATNPAAGPARVGGRGLKDAGPFAIGDFAVNFAGRRVILGGDALQLTAIECRPVEKLAGNTGRVLTNGVLHQQVLGAAGDGYVQPIHTLLSKIRRRRGGDPDKPTYICTEPMVGYRKANGGTV